MSAGSFNPDTEDEDETKMKKPMTKKVLTESDSEEKQDVQQPPVKKKRAVSEQQEWTEVNRWDHSKSWDEDILVYICQELDELNRSAGIQHVPGSHKDKRIVW